MLGVFKKSAERRKNPYGTNQEVLDESLFMEIEKGDLEGVTALLDNGAKIDALNEKNRTPLQVAVEVDPEPDVIRLLVERGADLHAEGLAGETPLSMCVTREDTDTLKLLIECGADVNHQDKQNGWTALTWAVTGSDVRPKTAVLLLENGADPYIQHKDGKVLIEDVLSWAEKFPDDPGHRQVKELLTTYTHGKEQAHRIKALRRGLKR